MRATNENMAKMIMCSTAHGVLTTSLSDIFRDSILVKGDIVSNGRKNGDLAVKWRWEHNKLQTRRTCSHNAETEKSRVSKLKMQKRDEKTCEI